MHLLQHYNVELAVAACICIMMLSLMGGCATYGTVQWRMDNGAVDVCRKVTQESCGLTLHECVSGKMYYCQQYVVAEKVMLDGEFKPLPVERP